MKVRKLIATSTIIIGMLSLVPTTFALYSKIDQEQTMDFIAQEPELTLININDGSSKIHPTSTEVITENYQTRLEFAFENVTLKANDLLNIDYVNGQKIKYWETNSKSAFDANQMRYDSGNAFVNYTGEYNIYVKYYKNNREINAWVSQPAITYKKIFFKPFENWKNDGARFAARVTPGLNGDVDAWFDFTFNDTLKAYEANLGENHFETLIICRMNGETQDNKWDYCWNQTYDLTFNYSSFVNFYTVNDKGQNETKYPGNWSMIPY